MRCFFAAFLLSYPLVQTVPIAGDSLTSSITLNKLEPRQLPAPRPLPTPHGRQSCPSNDPVSFYWQEFPNKRSRISNTSHRIDPIPSSTSDIVVRRQAGVKPSPLCTMISHFTFTILGRLGATTSSVKVYPGIRYVFSIGCDVAIESITTWYKNGDDSDPLHDWNVLTSKNNGHSAVGTVSFEVPETAEVQFQVRFAYFGASGEVGLFEINVQ